MPPTLATPATTPEVIAYELPPLQIFSVLHDHTPYLIPAGSGCYGCRICGAYPILLRPGLT